MKSNVASAFLLCLFVPTLSSAAFAQDATDWSGPYAGLAASSTKGDESFYTNGVFGDSVTNSGSTFGAFAGYNLQRGNIVYGAELAYSGSGIHEVGFPEVGFEHLLDLKSRVGYATGSALIYTTLGWSVDSWAQNGGTDQSDGLVYGIGADYKISERMFVGAEYLRRDIDSGSWPFSTEEVNWQIESITLRVGMTF